jgi:hypothetical protein
MAESVPLLGNCLIKTDHSGTTPLARLAHYETASAATAISVTVAMHDHVFHRTRWNPFDRPRLLLIQLQPNRGKHMSNPDQGGQQNQGGQPDQKPGQQQQKPGQGGQQGDPKPGQQEQQK